MSQKGKIQLAFIIVAPPDLVAEGDRIFKTHAPWLGATHPRSGDKALLSYNVSKARRGMSRALLKLSGSLVHDYATISDDSPSPNRASRARRAATSAGIS